MARTIRFTAAVLVALAAILVGAFLTAPVPSPAQPVVPAPSDGGGEVPAYDESKHGADGDTSTASDYPRDAVPYASQAEGGAVRSLPQGGAVDPSPDGAVPASDGGGDVAVTGTAPADGDDFDPTADALPADAPRVCVILDMGAAACDAFTHPAPGEVSVAVIYSDDDERAIVETIAYDEHGPIDYVDFWEGEVTPSE